MKNEVVIDTKETFARKISDNLQRSYLKGVSIFSKIGNKSNDDYDIQQWNEHVYDLSNLTYQKKIITNLNIPINTEFMADQKLKLEHHKVLNHTNIQ